MPLYEFSCAECGPFTELRRVSECDLPAACPACGTQAPRMISVPRLAIMTANNRKAWERNETSAHEPRHVQAGRSHGHQDTGKHHHQHNHSHKHVHNARPWMLGH